MGDESVIHSNIDRRAWAELISAGISNAISGLSKMINREITIITLIPRSVDIKDVPYLFGGPKANVVGIHLRVTGSAEGQILLVYDPKAAFELLDIMMGEPPGTTQNLGELEQSGLGEIGNIMGGYFLNALAASTGLQFLPSPPVVMMSMAEPILNIALSQIQQTSGESWIVESTFGTNGYKTNGTFLVLPNPEFLYVLTAAWYSKRLTSNVA